eukprot:CCRYP_012573-RB/>CCRYP_012573-RB protein AED:0.05 eAED:0.05 QI:140/1/1/1/0.85/0.75/8/284/1255
MFGFQRTLCTITAVTCAVSSQLAGCCDGLTTRPALPSSPHRRTFKSHAARKGEPRSRTIESRTTTSAATIDDATPRMSNASSRLEPLLTSFLFRSVRESTQSDLDDAATDTSRFTFSDACRAMLGLSAWESALRKGRLPLSDDFLAQDQTTWPDEPLFSHVYDALSALALPRLVRRHPEILTSVLLGVAKLGVDFTNMQRRGKFVIHESHNYHDDHENFHSNHIDFTMQQEHELEEYEGYVELSDQELKQLAESLSNKFTQQWAGVVQGVSMLDALFGYDHNMLDMQGDRGFGLQDGIWEHTGWEPLPELQKRLSKMPELRHLLSQLGRRPSAEGKMSRFLPRKKSYSSDDMLSVQVDEFNPTSVSGLCYSSSLTTMLPSEALFLRSSVKALRLLFLAKKAESKLLSYDLSGWTDVNTLPLPRKRRSVALPSATGGPIIICLDTSWSMSGLREKLAKAVVVASVQAATRQGRECRVVSFSSANNAMESGTIRCDADGVKRLLEFLTFSFGGGTDVTGALNFAIDTLEHDMASSDIILVTDGELPNPPVSKEMMVKLERLREQTGVEIHGLLVGRKESAALSSLCTSVHDFLVDYEFVNHASLWNNKQQKMAPPKQQAKSSSTALLAAIVPKPATVNCPLRVKGVVSKLKKLSNPRTTLSLYAARNSASEEFAHKSSNLRESDFYKLMRKRDIKPGTRKRRFLEDDESWDSQFDRVDEVNQYGSDSYESFIPTKAQEGHGRDSEFLQRVDDAYKSIEQKVTLELRKWSRDELESEVKRSHFHSKRNILLESISYVESGLIERNAEAKLVVLGMVSQEHILFIGPPGTSKSELGRRLSQLCGGPFFQRLFTRFTTPEEIFGPLSLRALENDEYLRCIDGFLPTANVAFLDEIFKANSSILNTLLTILNERQFDNGAGMRVQCPLKCVIGASNELPESEELDALLDRFLLRAHVLPVSDAGLMQMLTQITPTLQTQNVNLARDLEHLVSDISLSLETISLDQNICVLIQKLRKFARDEMSIYISDRRLVKASRLLRVSAATHGRAKVDYVDCLLLENILWQTPEQLVAIREWLLDNLTPGDEILEQSRFLLNGLASEALALVKKTMGDVTGESGARKDDLEAIGSVQREVEQINTLLQRHSEEVERYVWLVHDLQEHIWLSRDAAHAAKQFLTPLAAAAANALKDARSQAFALKIYLSDQVENDLRSSLIEMFVDNTENEGFLFTEDELRISMKEAKRKFDGVTLRRWKSARRQTQEE